MNKQGLSRLCCFAALITILLGAPLSAQERVISIRGLSIYSEKKLLKTLGIPRSLPYSQSPRQLIEKINGFYHDRGYILVRTYIVQIDRTSIELFVDEGRLGRIIFYDLNTYDMLRVKYVFTLKDKIYNKKQVEKNIIKLKREFGFLDVNVKIIPADNYNNSIFQIDRDLNIPILRRHQIAFFDKIGYRYNMEVHFEKKKGARSSTGKREGFAFKITTEGSRGVIPMVRYYRNDNIVENDFLNTGTSVGLMYGWDGEFDSPPHVTYMSVDADYHLPPMLMNYFTPLVRGNFLISNSSRKDLDILEFRYSKTRGLVFPGLTLLDKLKLYLGAGVELSHLYNSVSDPDATNPVVFNDEKTLFYLVESELKFELLPIRIGNPLDRNFSLVYDYYDNHTGFHKLNISAMYDFAFQRNDILAFATEYTGLWGDVPYHYEQPVVDSVFKGFQGLDIYTWSIWSFSVEYRFSIYRDFIYFGMFVDNTVFKGTGYDYSGIQVGLAGGVTGRFIILDQFEWIIYYSRDWLIREMESQNNLYFKFLKKW